ncbi:MAG: prepilin peptidase [Pelagibacterales bacterium]|nr:prepilin peptidase [Pelagibacterales bacterium]
MDFFSLLNLQIGVAGQVLLISCFALIFGSFASLISYRLATKEPIVIARSKCVKCGVVLKVKNLIPLFSWLFQRGKCSNCGDKISARYPLIETSFVLGFLTCYFVFGQKIDLKLILACLIFATLVVMIVVDLERYFIPDITQYFLAVLVTIWLVNEGGNPAVFANIKSAFLYVAFGLALIAFFYVTTKTEALGIDDVKFFFIAGLAFGTKGFLFFMLVSGILGVVFGPIWQYLRKDKTFPFAPAICTSFFVALLCERNVNLVEMLGSLIF